MLFSFLAEVVLKLNIIFKSSSVTTLATRVTGTALLLSYLFFLFSTYYIMATHGKMSAFDGSKESLTSYSERLDFYFKANKITAADSQKAVFITVIGVRATDEPTATKDTSGRGYHSG